MPPLPKTCPKTVCPRKEVAFLWKAFLQKNFQVREKIPLSIGLLELAWTNAPPGREAAQRNALLREVHRLLTAIRKAPAGTDAVNCAAARLP
jgi:hypothetical protein